MPCTLFGRAGELFGGLFGGAWKLFGGLWELFGRLGELIGAFGACFWFIFAMAFTLVWELEPTRPPHLLQDLVVVLIVLVINSAKLANLCFGVGIGADPILTTRS